jgi:hypothetical protein
MPEEAIASELPAAAPASAASPAAVAEQPQLVIDSAMADVGRLRREAMPHSATPEAWYAEIERLRAAGEIAEADRQLEHLKIVYPGWLEQHAGEVKKKERRP